MEETALPIVPGTGKYAGKSVLELMADDWYVNNFLKQKSWFSPTNKNWAPIYNIIVNQNISTNKDGKTPEHNRLQNLFLDENNQHKLVSNLFKIELPDGINNLLDDDTFIRCFGKIKIQEFTNNLDRSSVKFEDKFNFDVIVYYKDTQTLSLISKTEIELIDKEKYKQEYDIEQKEKYDSNLSQIDELIAFRVKLDQNKINEYEKNMKDYQDKSEKYENDLKNYLQQKYQNEKNIANYEKELKIFNDKKTLFATQKLKIFCLELAINYDYFMNWDILNNGHSYSDRDTKHTTEQKKQLREIIYDKLKPFITEFERINTIPNFVEKLNMPTKPHLPQKYDFSKEIYIHKDSEIYQLFEEAKKIKHMHYLYSVDDLNKYKKDYENEYKKDYENEYIKNYEKYRLQYYSDIIDKYCNKDKNYVYVKKNNENQYEITTKMCDNRMAVCCELKPTLSDDYPCVLRKLKTQIELIKNDQQTRKDGLLKSIFATYALVYVLIIGSFTSIHVSKEQLITIFKQSNITIVFTDNIFEPSKLPVIEYINTQQLLYENKLIEENKTLTYNLLQTQEKLLQSEDKIKQLEEEILSLKSQKQSKNIKDYFGKK